MTFVKTSLLAGALSLAASVSVHAATVDITGGETTVTVTADLGSLGLTPALTGTATEDNGALVFNITGGSVDTGTGAALIEHDGSGLNLSDGNVTTMVSDFLIDTTAGTVSGMLNNTIDDVVFFTFGSTSPQGIQLLVSDQLALALTAAFMAPNLSGAEFGFASAAPEVESLPAIPLPAGLPLLAVGLVAFGVIRRQQKKAA